jgi:hypothetical protein
MHQLERRAQADPFLMDAMEGYESSGRQQQTNLNDITSRIQQRIAPQQRRIIPWRYMAMAASVLVVFTIGGLWLFNGRHKELQMAKALAPREKGAPAAAEKPPVADSAKAPKEAEKIALNNASLKRKVYAADIKTVTPAPAENDALKNAPVVNEQIAGVRIKDSVPKDSTPLNETIVMAYNSKPVADTVRRVAKTRPVILKKAAPIPAQLLTAQAPGVAVNNNPAPVQQYGNVLSVKIPPKTIDNPLMQDKANEGYFTTTVKGRVINKGDNMPVAGALVKISGTNIGTLTDVNGLFRLSTDSIKTNVVIANAGYKTVNVNTNNGNAINTISLEPTRSSLKEIKVTARKGYSSNPGSAQPKAGWDSFKKYLDEKAISPDGKKGVVKLSFMVGRYGLITGIKVNSGLSPATDKVAVNLVANGPEWVGNGTQKLETVNLDINFDK